MPKRPFSLSICVSQSARPAVPRALVLNEVVQARVASELSGTRSRDRERGLRQVLALSHSEDCKMRSMFQRVFQSRIELPNLIQVR